MIIKNVKIFSPKQRFIPGSIRLNEGRIEKVLYHESVEAPEDEVLDGHGSYCFPGMIDLHFHGCMGDDVCDGTVEALQRIAEYEASQGVTAICPATMTLPLDELNHILKTMAQFHHMQQNQEVCGADFVGINMEGPFISPVKKGAQDDRNIIPCNVDVYKEFQASANGLVKFIGIAPEESDAEALIKEAKKDANVSLAHTNADYETAKKAFDVGANHAVHLYNGMSGFSHRAPGVVGAAVDSKHVMAEIICDGVHVHPAAIRVTFEMFGKDRLIFISDSMRAAGMPDGQYTLGGLDVKVKGKEATLVSDGALAGSVTTLPNCVRTAVKEMKIPLEDALACATINPAISLGIEKDYGTIEEGKMADLVLWNEELEQVCVIKNGKQL